MFTRKSKRSRYLDPVGISVHIGSQIQTAEPFGAALEAVAELIRELGSDGIEIKFVDAGGGLGIDYLRAAPPSIRRRRWQSMPPQWNVASRGSRSGCCWNPAGS